MFPYYPKVICINFDLNVLGHSAPNVVQQLFTPACQNCSQHRTASAESVTVILDNQIHADHTAKSPAKSSDKMERPINDEAIAAAVAAAEIISPDEALPEEMMPDQESPAFQPSVIKTEPQQPPSPIPESFPQQQEHAQQQESLKIDEQHQKSLISPSFAVSDNASPAVHSEASNAHADNMSRTLLHLETKKVASSVSVHSNARTAKIQSVGAVKGAVRMNSVTQEHPQPQPKVGSEEENLPVLTRSLYQAGHYLPPKDVCPEQGEGMKLMILVTTAPGHAAQREAVRSTWGHVAFRRDVGMAFMVGTSKNHSENSLIEQENFIYGDIIQVSNLRNCSEKLSYQFD